ncbi:uncharacterized protein LOC133312605 isoform X2 [Gastrolobium bilobum]|uniref:uncharacterized protein LOC133312605 isoform X2 n=1 Tax=Gastrolobium bilobum TaxID=150636 RepID=UPI002AB218BE|nr:uncharacterized protein LOC133312605 isoform X2 [Gastrolobium bilobum]
MAARDYTSKMRSIDVFKCWPFTTTTSRDVTREEVQSWLPPMTRCPRSNHNDAQNPENQPSAREVSRTDDDVDDDDDDDNCSQDSAKSEKSAPPSTADTAADDEKLEMVCPVCREFNAATLTAVNAHIDGCLSQSMREERRHMRMMNLKPSSKSKAPKKRSIAEIFKVEEEEQEKEQEQEQQKEQPQIESVLKFWPFHEEDGTDDDVSSTVTKFQWLSRRLEALRSNRGGSESAKSDKGDSAEEEKLEMVCPVCRDFNAATVTAVNAHIDGCLAQAVRDERRQMRRTCSKPKTKLPKKRSIAEILTVAPPIEASKSKAIEVEEDEDKSDYCGGDSSAVADADADAAVVSVIKSKKSTNKNRKTKKTKKAKKKKKKSKVEKLGDSVVSLNNENKTIVNKKKKRKKKRKNVFNNELTGKKEDAYKCMVQTPVNSSRKLKGTIGNKMVALDDIDPSVYRKKSSLIGLSIENKQEVKNCDSVGKQQKAVSPVCGILKNHLKHVSGTTSSGCNIRDGTEESHYNDQVATSDRNVRFSGKDGILSPKRRNSFCETMFNISSEVLATSLVKEQSSGSDEETASFEANRNYDHIAINTDEDKRKEVFPIVESKQFSNTLEQVTVRNFLKPCTNQEKSKHLEEKSELLTKVAVCDNNLQRFDGGNTTTLHCSPYADISRPLSAVQEVQMSGINTQVCESGAFCSSGKFIDHLEDPTFQVDAVRSNANTKTFLEPSSSYYASYNKANERSESPLQTYGDNGNSDQALGDGQLSNMFSSDMIDSSFPFTGWGKRNSCLDPNFFGLPLNSHGELINFSSSGKVGMKQPETSSTLRDSLSGLPINNMLRQNSEENLSMNERHVVRRTFPKDGLNPFPHDPARLAATEFQCSEREDIHWPNSDMCSSHHVQSLDSKLNLKKNLFIEQNQRGRVRSHNGNGMISQKECSDHISLSSSQPTVRLMGKDVPIGRSNNEMQQFAGDVWTDEGSRRKHYSEYAALENSFLGRCSKQDRVCGSPLQISTDNSLHSAKTQRNQALQSTILMNGTDSGFPQQFIDLQSNHVSQNGSLGVSRNASSYFNPIAQQPSSIAVFNGAPDVPEQFIPGAKPLGLSSQSQVLPAPCNILQPTCSSNGELNDRNKNPHVTKSAFGFPFLQPAVNEQAKASWFQRPYRSLPSWLSSSTDEMLPGTFSHQFSGVSSQSFPQNQWGNNLTTPSVNHSAEVLRPSSGLTSLGPMLCPASIVQPLHVPVTPSTLNSGCRNMNMVPDRMKLDDMITKDHHHPCTNTRKRPAANLDDSRKPIKLPNIEGQENMSRMIRLTGQNSSVELQRNTRAMELDPQVDSGRSRCRQNKAQKLNPTGYPAVDSFQLDGTVTSGPVRLGPGAKHILKSS